MIQPQRFQLFAQHHLKWLLINRSTHAEDGFTLSEVLVAILLTTTFVAVSMQGMVVAMLLKSKALQIAETSQWMQTDLERVRATMTLGSIPLAPNQSRCHPVSADRGFADLIRDNLAGVDVIGSDKYQLPTLTFTSKTGKTFQVVRTVSIPPVIENAHFNILGIQYVVTPNNGTKLAQSIFHSYTEVMPDAALQCQ